MAQESAQLNQNLLKHLRTQKGETQEYISEVCGVTLRQYQNIEKDGCTTNKVIQLLSTHFGISPTELSTNIKEDNSLWYITNTFSKVGEIARGYHKAIEEIKSWVKTPGFNYEPQLTIVDNTQVKKITIALIDSELTWSMRPIELNEKIGLLWTELSDWQQDTWKKTRDELLYGCFEKVCLNGTPLIPEGASSKFIVEFIEYAQRKKIATGYRVFNSADEFRISFTEWLDTVRLFEPLCSPPGMFSMNYDFKDDMTKAIRIRKVWVNENGEIKRAPWSATNIKELTKTIADRAIGQLQPLPIDIGERFDGEDIAPFGPDVTYRKVTELPEIEFSIESEQ